MTDTTEEAKETFHEQEKKDLEKERKKELSYIYKYINNLNQSINQRKIPTCISVEESIHDAVKFIAPFFGTTASDLYVEGALDKLKELIPRLPENIQLNLIRQINVKQEADPEIAGLKIDIAYEQLAFWIKRLRAVPANVWVKNNLQKQLNQSMKLAATSGNDPLKQLVHEARELLRGSLH